MANPLRPGTDKNPTNQGQNIALAFAMNKSLWRRVAKRIGAVIDALPYNKITTDAPTPIVRKQDKRTAMLTNHLRDSRYIWANRDFDISQDSIADEIRIFNNGVQYEFLVDSAMMDNTMDAIDVILRQDILSNSNFWTRRFWLTDFINEAAQDGTTDSFESAVNITLGTDVEPSLSILSAQQQLQTPVYLDRLRLANGRVFEEMKGLTSEMKSQLRLTLTEGIARGVGIRDLKGLINKRLSVGLVRAERIARTEINHVYRSSYMDEAKDLNSGPLKDSVYEIRQMHRSALSPTTRQKHAVRHGTTHTMQEQQTWWAVDGNLINCLCSTLDVLYNKNTGKILQSKLQETMLKQREQFTGIKD